MSVHFITGPSNSGKTSLLHGVFGGYKTTGHDVPSILESAEYMDDATEAWIRQHMSGCTNVLCVDEAEINDNTDHSSHVQAIQRMLYTIPMGGTVINRGGQTAEQRMSYKLRMPVLMAAIKMNKDPVFLSRVFVIELVKDIKHRPIDDYIYEYFTPSQIQQLKKDMTVALLPHIMNIMRLRDELHAELLKAPVDAAVTDRFIQSVLTGLTVYKYVDPEGHDAVELFKRMVHESRDRINSIQNVNLTNDILDAVLYTDLNIKTSQTANIANAVISARFLIMGGELSLLHGSGIGIFYDADEAKIIIVWKMVRHTVLLRAAQGLSRKSESELLNDVMDNMYVVHNVTMEYHRKIVKLFKLEELHGPSDYTVLRAEYFLAKEAQEALRERAKRDAETVKSKRIDYVDVCQNPDEPPPYMDSDIPLESDDLVFS